jgi:hypothetical protein
MSRLRPPPERHLVNRIGWLRAAVLGANHGLLHYHAGPRLFGQVGRAGRSRFRRQRFGLDLRSGISAIPSGVAVCAGGSTATTVVRCCDSSGAGAERGDDGLDPFVVGRRRQPGEVVAVADRFDASTGISV